MPTLTMTKGLPASGKSTWAKKIVKQDGNTKRINKDDLRAMIDDSKFSWGREKKILQVRDLLVTKFLEDGMNVIVDDTNLHPKHEARLRQLAEKHESDFKIKDFTHVDKNECIERDLRRENSVGKDVILGMWKSFLKPPVEQYNPDKALPPAIICDIDGTLAHMTGRSPYDWDRVGEDELDKTIADIVSVFFEYAHVILMSGRDGECYEATEAWLQDNLVPYDELHLRSAGDIRKDVVVKKELFDEHVRDKYNVLFVLDDRNQTVDGWRDLGLKCLQVAEGDF